MQKKTAETKPTDDAINDRSRCNDMLTPNTK